MTTHRLNLHPHRADGSHTIRSAGLTVWWWAVLATGVLVLTMIVMFTVLVVIGTIGEFI